MSALFVRSEDDRMLCDYTAGATPIAPISGQFFIVAKVYPVAALAAVQSVVWLGDSTVNTRYFDLEVWASGNSCVFLRDVNGTSELKSASEVTLAPGAWSSLAAEFVSATEVYARVNATRGTVGTTNIPVHASFDRLAIGSFRGIANPTGQSFDGYIAEVAIVSGLLTEAKWTDYKAGMTPNQVWGASVVEYISYSSSLTVPETGNTLTNVGATLDTATHPTRLNYTPVLYDQIEDVYSASDPATIKAILFNQNESSEKRIAVYGDSTSSEYGGQGTVKMQAVRSRLHDYNQHTPATGITPPNVALGGASAQKWAEKAIINNGTNETTYTADQLPPGYTPGSGGSVQRLRLVATTSGALKMFDHKNDGLSLVPLAVDKGISGYTNGTMIGSKSVLDARSGKLKLRVLGLTRSGSASTMVVNARPAATLDPLNASAAIQESFTIFGGSQDLNAAVGVCYSTEVTLADLVLASARYQTQICGSSATAGTGAVLLGAEFISTNKKGCGVDSFSAGGYRVLTPSEDHANCGFVVSALPRGAIVIALGQNDQNAPNSLHPALFYEAMLVAIPFFRSLYGDSTMPVILEAPTLSDEVGDSGSFTKVGKYYPSINRYLAATLSNVYAVNTPALTWDEADVGTYTSDGVHPNATGALMLGKNVIDALATFTGTQDPAASGGANPYGVNPYGTSAARLGRRR